MKYDHKQVEKKWQDIWDEKQCFHAENDSDKEKFYALVEFPYPSGQGLHVGHPRSYTALDIVARKKRMQGYNVLHPMGYDSFGLPAEQYAVNTGHHPNGFTQKNIETFSQYALRNLQDIDIVYPGTKWLTPERAAWIAQDFSDFEKTLYSYDYDTEPYAWWEQADMSSFVDYFILNEFTCNYDAGWLSTYIYRDVRGKYKMCIWDFNSACDNYSHPVAEPQHFELQYNVWYYMLSKDEKFINAVIDRYRELRQGILSDEYLCAYIDDVTAWLGDAVERNFSVWGYTLEKDMLSPAWRNPHSHAAAVAQMKRFCIERGAWMDENIDILRQYSHESKNKKFNH